MRFEPTTTEHPCLVYPTWGYASEAHGPTLCCVQYNASHVMTPCHLISRSGSLPTGKRNQQCGVDKSG
jgi:hypothetical protein